MQTTCGHCHIDYELTDGHDCIPECYHCGATYSDLENPEYESAKIAVSRHERECSERPEGWGVGVRDPEGEWREERREQDRIRQWEERQRKEGHVW